MEFVEIISNIGFPIVMTIILMTKIETKIDLLTNSINNLIKEIEKINKL